MVSRNVALNNNQRQTLHKTQTFRIFVGSRPRFARSAANHYVTVFSDRRQTADGRWHMRRSYDVICAAVM